MAVQRVVRVAAKPWAGPLGRRAGGGGKAGTDEEPGLKTGRMAPVTLQLWGVPLRPQCARPALLPRPQGVKGTAKKLKQNER